jgi:hypothetical protein
MPIGELLAVFRHVDLIRFGRRFQPRCQMLGGAADLVNLGELAGDHVGDHVSGMQADPNLESGIAETGNTPDELDRGMAGQRSMIVVRDRRAEHRRESIAQLLADNAAELTHRAPHRGEGRLEA